MEMDLVKVMVLAMALGLAHQRGAAWFHHRDN
jgi:hypothetical protein